MKHREQPETASFVDVLIVGIGASAGGIEPVKQFLGAVSDEAECIAFVVIMHLDPDRESSLAEVLQPATSLRVSQLTGRQKIESRHVYVIPPDRSLVVADGHLDLTEYAEPRGHRAPIDLFLRSLADARDAGIAVLMSGGGSDGVVGLKAIKEAGGVVMVQDPDEATHDSMPHSAIATGLVDYVLPAAELARKVVAFRSAWQRIRVPTRAADLPRDEDEALGNILGHLHNRTGHDFSSYKQPTVLRRIERRMQMHQTHSLGGYLDFLREHPSESVSLLKSLLISVTQFFRDPEAWEVLAESVVRDLIEEDPTSPLRIWVPGCATGEEAYSIVMLFLEAAAGFETAPDIQVFATDLDDDALAYARRAIYPEAIAADVSEERLRRFFTKEGDHYRASEELRERVLFASHDLLKDPPFSRLHLVACRNLLIYLDRDLQSKVFRVFQYALHPGGYLFLGTAETIEGERHAFESIDKAHRIYRRRETGAPPRLPIVDFSNRVTRTVGRGTFKRPDAHSPIAEMRRHHHLLEQEGPPSVVVGSDYEIIHLSETAGRYLRRPGGRPSADLLREIRPELRLDLQVALAEAFKNGRATSSHPIRLETGGETTWVHVIVRPSAESDPDERALVLFAEVESAGGEGSRTSADPDAASHRDARVERLEEEIRLLRSRLQTTIEDYESSNEEMKAANEELQSMNEEYKSTTEELETSKEELQSVNEELATVNQQLNVKVDELASANNDLRNLMAATEVGTLFLDRDLSIQRYTPQITELFNVMPGDVGRPISHLTHEIAYDDLVDDARQVLSDLVPLEREVRGRRGRWYLMRMRPYRTIDDRIDGVVLTFLDITARREGERARHRAEERYRLLVENVHEYAIVTLDLQGRVASWNVGAERIYGYDEAEVIGESGAIILTPDDRQAGLFRDELEAAAAGRQVSAERWNLRKDGSKFWATGVMAALHLADGELRGFALVTRDNTERKRAQEAMEEFARTLEARVAERTQQVRDLASNLTMAEHHERTRIAHVLYDDLQQVLYSIQMKLSLMQESGDGGGQAATTADGLSQIGSWVDTALAVVYRLTVDLSPPVLDEEGLAAALTWIRESMRKEHGLDVEIDAAHPFYIPDEDWRVLLFQVVRELLLNVVEHADTDRATVALRDGADELVIEVSDHGRGFDPRHMPDEGTNGGAGLPATRRRLHLFGGRLDIQSAPGAGTRVTVRAPVQPHPSSSRSRGGEGPDGA